VFQTLVYEGGLDPEYVLDKMRMYEAEILIDGIWKKKRQEWEQARLIAWVTLRCNTKSKVGLSEFLPFEWDKEKNEAPVVTEEDRMRLNARAKALEAEFKKQNKNG
jgi:hypothetical protein